MTVHRTIELDEAQDAQLQAMAEAAKVSVEDMAQRVLAERLDYDRWFRAKVQEGIEAADRGDFIDHDEVFARLHERMSRAVPAAE